jgi:alpha-tubulin suppressor-like RCC1 family protein
MPSSSLPEDHLKQRRIDDPLPRSSFGSIGVYLEVDFEPEVERPLLSVPYSKEELGHVDETTLRLFEVDVEARAFTLLEDSTVDVEERLVLGRLEHPGVYGVIGLPEDPRVLEAVSLFEQLRQKLLKERGLGQRGLQASICELILCAPEGAGAPGVPGGDLCELCLGIHMPGHGLPEIQLWEPPRRRPGHHEPSPEPPKPPASWRVLGWGFNDSGQVGDGSTTDRYSEVWVADLDHVTAVTGGGVGFFGGNFSLALAADGTLWGWGANVVGQLGVPGPSSTLTPIPAAAGLSPVKQMAAGNGFALAVKADGTVWAWGDGGAGQLGMPGNFPFGPHSATPVEIPGLSDVVMVAAGAAHCLALASDGSVWAWGYNALGQLGSAPGSPNHVPAEVPGLNGVVAIAAGSSHGLAVRSDGSVWAWGNNEHGQLGKPVQAGAFAQPQPDQVAGIADATSVDGGAEHSIVLKADGTVWSFGENNLGQLGDGTYADRDVAAAVAGLTGVVQVAAGGGHNLALATGGVLWGWGHNYWGQVGDGTAQWPGPASPVQVVGPPVAERWVGCGPLHSLALGS